MTSCRYMYPTFKVGEAGFLDGLIVRASAVSEGLLVDEKTRVLH